MQQVLDNLGEVPTSAGAKDIDLLFLRGIMESPIVGTRTELRASRLTSQPAQRLNLTPALAAVLCLLWLR